MSFSRERVASEYESMYGRHLWSEETRKNYRQLAYERRDRVLNGMRHQPIHWEPRIVRMKQVDSAEQVSSRLAPSPRKDSHNARENVIKGSDDQLPKSHSTLEVDQRRKGSQISGTNYECCQKSCPNLSVSPQNVVNSSSNEESREWLVHIDFDPEKRADKDCNKDVQTIKVTTTRINPEATSSSGKDKKAQSSKEKSRSSSPVSESKPKTSAKPSSLTHEVSQETREPEEKSSSNLSEDQEDETSLMLKRLLRPTIRSVPPVRPKPHIQHQVSKSRVPVVAWEKTQQTPSSPEVTKSCPTETNTNQIARKNPPFAMYGVNDNGIRQTYNVGPARNSKEVHSSALRAKKERERLQLFRREVEKKKPPMIKQPQSQLSMKVFCDALCAQNKPREPDAWSTEYKRNFTSCYDFTPKRPVFKPIREFDKQLAVSKQLC